MYPRFLPFTSAFLLGLYTFLLYAFRCGSARWIKQFTGGSLNLAASYVLGPWLPASGRLAFALPILVILIILALSRALRHSPPAVLALHSISWMLGLITLPIILLARDFALIQVPGGLTFVTPEVQKQLDAVEFFEASWFWILVALSTLALFACLKRPSPRKSLPCPLPPN